MKRSRQKKILELIGEYDIETQEELAALLVQAGYQVTQATISRDIRELKLSKVPATHGRQKYQTMTHTDPETSDRYTRVLREGYVSGAHATDLVVIKTVSGMAMAVAAALDAMEIPGIVGSIAGDDTIFCAIRSAQEAQTVMTHIRRVIQDVSGG